MGADSHNEQAALRDQRVRGELERRATALAASQEQACNQGLAGRQYLVFRLAGEAMAVAAEYVVEVLRSPAICPIPCTPAWAAGVVNVRGRVVAVLDPGLYWGLAQQALAESVVVVLASPGASAGASAGSAVMELGLAVAKLEGVRALGEDLQPPALLASGIAAIVEAVAPGPVLVLDGERLLADRGLIVQEEVA